MTDGPRIATVETLSANDSWLTDSPGVDENLLAFYLDLHRCPELSGAEQRTAERLGRRLGQEGFEVTTGIGGHGVVGRLVNGAGPVVGLRTELDGLPVVERSGLPYASSTTSVGSDGRPTGVMHACGHDVHIAAVAGAAARLARSADTWSGTVLVIGQPAEETLAGARAMVADGLYRRFGRPDVLLAQHVAPLPAGMVAHGHGPMTAAAATIAVVIHGRGGHAGSPHLAVDAIVAAAATVLRLQTVVAREFSPSEQVVLSVGSLHAGTADNVLPDRATMTVTIRGGTDDVVDRALAATRRIVIAECQASGCVAAPDIDIVSRAPATINDPTAAAVVRQAHENTFGRHRVAAWPGSMATEDFPYLADPPGVVPLVYWILGCAGPRQWAAATGHRADGGVRAIAANHSAEFAPDARLTLPAGVSAMYSAATAFLGTSPDLVS